MKPDPRPSVRKRGEPRGLRGWSEEIRKRARIAGDPTRRIAQAAPKQYGGTLLSSGVPENGPTPNAGSK
jgi:hypothetical protein